MNFRCTLTFVGVLFYVFLIFGCGESKPSKADHSQRKQSTITEQPMGMAFNVPTKLRDSSSVVITAKGAVIVRIPGMQGRRWIKQASALVATDGKDVHLIHYEGSSWVSSIIIPLNSKLKVRSLPTVIWDISDNLTKLAVWKERSLLFYDLESGATRVFDSVWFRKQSEMKNFRIGATQPRICLNKTGSQIAIGVSSEDRLEENSLMPYVDTYVIDTLKSTAKRIGEGDPQSWIADNQLLVTNFSKSSWDGMDRECRVYDLNGNIIAKQSRVLYSAWDGDNIFVLKKKGAWPYKFYVEVWNQDFSKKIDSWAEPQFDSRYICGSIAAIPKVSQSKK